MEWVRIWLFTTWRTDHLAKIEATAATAAELRTLINAARADPHVRRWHHQSRRELVGQHPATCRNGHDLSTRGSGAAPHDWLPCNCGGHWWIQCRECRDETLDPPAAYDCNPRTPQRRH